MLKLLYDDMEQLAVCRELLWVLYANANKFRTVWTVVKIELCFSS